jgi:hypothetical protein
VAFAAGGGAARAEEEAVAGGGGEDFLAFVDIPRDGGLAGALDERLDDDALDLGIILLLVRNDDALLK